MQWRGGGRTATGDAEPRLALVRFGNLVAALLLQDAGAAGVRVALGGGGRQVPAPLDHDHDRHGFVPGPTLNCFTK